MLAVLSITAMVMERAYHRGKCSGNLSSGNFYIFGAVTHPFGVFYAISFCRLAAAITAFTSAAYDVYDGYLAPD